MKTNEEVVQLRQKVDGLLQEVRLAIRFHEAWKPVAYDRELQARMGNSRATNTFLDVRTALRREMILSLMRLWDKKWLPAIANSLRNQNLKAALVRDADCITARSSDHKHGDPGHPSPEKQVELVVDAIFKQRDDAFIRKSLEEVLLTISKYQEGGAAEKIMADLRSLRDERLAHFDLTVPVSARDLQDDHVEAIYQESRLLVRKLYMVIKRRDFLLDGVDENAQLCATYFWKSVTGERTPGHPDFTPTRDVETQA